MSFVLKVLPFLALCAFGAADPSDEKPELKLTIKTNRERYNVDGTVFVAAEFKGDSQAKIQFAPGNGAVYFYVVLQSLDHKDKDGKGLVICRPAWEMQFVQRPFTNQRPPAHSIKVGWGLTHQLALNLTTLMKLPEGMYTLRIGYTLHGDGLKALIEEATQQKPKVDSIGGEILDGTFGGAILSEPVTITIGPDKEKEKK